MARAFIYLDHAATSPLRAEAREAMERHGDRVFATPSGSHRASREARTAIDEARDSVAAAIGCTPGEVVFTSGGTEGANSAVLGAVRRHGGTAVCAATEHHAVLHCVEHVGGAVVAVDAAGRVDLDHLSSVLVGHGDVSVVSVMAVNNETGVVNDLAAVSQVVRQHAPGAVLHTDAVQAACWLDLAPLWGCVDVLTMSAHKFGGPKGTGIMAVREGVHLDPILMGGGQERDRRRGTHQVAGVVGTEVG
ncbi:MAG: cysteine desulfurase family protein, partial [Actinomycetota bacterium]